MSLLTNESNEMVQVVLRCRPINQEELLTGCVSVVKVNQLSNTVEIYNTKSYKTDYCKVYTFDAAYDYSCTNQSIFDQSVKGLIRSILSGFNGTIFAYGQSGAGKTHTMEGEGNDKGIVIRTFEEIFDIISKSCKTQYLVRASYLEIYRDNIRDLLCTSNIKCELRESKELGVYVKNISSFVCKNIKQIKTLIDSGNKNRCTGFTDMNARSSRSHAIVTITVEMGHMEDQSKSPVRVGKLNLVDLAGSERQSKTNTEGKRLKEASRINLSLTALGNVISALADNKGHFVPYRDSKLTRLLRNSLGGNSKTLMIANIGPANCNYDESLNTLRYASRARNIKNKPYINEDPVDALLKKYQEEIKRLKMLLDVKDQIKNKEKINRCASARTVKGNNFECYNNESNKNKEDLIPTIKHSHEYNVDELTKRIEFMESKLLTGSSNIIEHTFEQQKALTARKNEIKEFEQREKDIQEMIELQKEFTEEKRGNFSYLYQEVENKSKELLKMYHKLQSIKQEIVDAREEFNKDRRELEITKYELWKDMKLRILIMDNFVPNKDRRRMLSKLFFDEELDAWKVLPETELRQFLPKLKCADNLRRPITLFTKITQRKANHIFRCNRTLVNREKTLRFKAENILELEQFQSLPRIEDYQHVRIPSQLLLKFKNAFQEEEDIDIDAESSIFLKSSAKEKFENVLQSYCNYSCQSTKAQSSVAIYPTARGLVPK